MSWKHEFFFYLTNRLWYEVTKNLYEKNVEAATEGKRFLEQRQRDEAKERKEKGKKWEPKVNKNIMLTFMQ